MVRTGQNPANQKHTAACQTGDLSFSASHLSEQMATQHTFHIRLLHGGDRQTRFKHSMPGDVAGACQDARLLFVQTGKNCSLHLQSPTRSSTENILSLISIHAASVSSRLGFRTEFGCSHAFIGVATKTHLIIIRPWRSCVHQTSQFIVGMLATTSGDGTGDGEIGAALRLGNRADPIFSPPLSSPKLKFGHYCATPR